MDDPADLLQIKIELARAKLPAETLNAINAVDWKAAILSLRATRGYTFEQLGDLEIETELVLSGLLSPENYPKELESKMGISRSAANELVEEMGNLVFKKIREELIKNIERKRIFQKTEKLSEAQHSSDVFNSAGIDIIDENKKEPPKPAQQSSVPPETETLPVEEKLEIEAAPIIEMPNKEKKDEKPNVSSILAQKFSNSFKVESAKTEYSLNNISKIKGEESTAEAQPKVAPTSYAKNGDPYRLSPDE